ncbi:DUF5671 domain-containing protein [Roseitranquillus sediminis]|uniref:DUF5671 domain-containing protein n=1 Tax=Roseitranquillus sediminis TaxID=2809051 RepID=UPI001D0CAA6C|nr:DUF5671 domain-containing protein [Roseitranquillus sediminis]MBM9595311.1 hypothetical protein [Roseitranquillus sediminis]
MARRDRLQDFVREALLAGRSRDEVARALVEAGWSEGEVRGALAAWSDTAFVPPVPQPTSYVSSRDAFVYMLILLALVFGAYHLIQLLHAIIDLTVEDPLDRTPWVATQLRWAVAMLIVAGPLYAGLTWWEARRVAADPGRRRSAVRHALTYLALFLSACVFLGDLVALIYRFLDGELTMRFALKVAAVALVSAVVFLHYLGDTGDAER